MISLNESADIEGSADIKQSDQPQGYCCRLTHPSDGVSASEKIKLVNLQKY
jgi:hypothetical protein